MSVASLQLIPRNWTSEVSTPGWNRSCDVIGMPKLYPRDETEMSEEPGTAPGASPGRIATARNRPPGYYQ